MQKKLSIFLSILLIIAVFCGCSKQSPSPENTTASTTVETTSSVFETTESSTEISKTEKATSTSSKSKNGKTVSKKADETTSKKGTSKTEKKSEKATATTKAAKSKNSESSKATKNHSSVKSTQSFVTSDTYTVTASAHSKTDNTSAKATSSTSSKKTCTITIECKSILDNMDKLAKGHDKYVPKDGIIVNEYKATFNGKASVYDLLKKACADNNIPYSSKTTTYSVYISGINNLDEFDCGKNSGWMYSVNGKFPNVSCDSTKLKDGDKVVFTYTCSYKK